MRQDIPAAIFKGMNGMKNVFSPADILLPRGDFSKWAVIACDQYTSQPEYWQRVKEYAAGSPSALNIIFPEVYLSVDNSKKIAEINDSMKNYLENGVFQTLENTFVYVKRTVTGGKTRRGIVGLIDLEDYSYEKGAKTLIRATEETVPERIPPRVEIRRDALLEIPHAMLLIDDPDMTVIAPLDEKTAHEKPVYDFDLMLGAGHITGKALNAEISVEVQAALNRLLSKSDDNMLFAVGDGNHSLAAAKECYRLNKTEASRYALVEIVNIHDESLEFEPIYRAVFGESPERVINDFIVYAGGEYRGENAQKFTCVYGDKKREISVRPLSKLCVGTLQGFLNGYVKENDKISVDYIHGEDAVKKLASNENTVGFIFKGMQKNELFDAVRQDGSLPRKTFSMGNADDKRFYLEARKL